MKMLEREVESYLVKRVSEMGGDAIKLQHTTAGMPDRLVVLPGGKTVMVELKRPGETARKLQIYWQQRFERMGFRSEVIDSKDGVDALLREI